MAPLDVTSTARRAAGFTLIEVMVAIVLAGIAVTGLMAMYLVQGRASGVARHITEASLLAEDQMERLRTTPSATTGSQAGLDELGHTVAGGRYTRSWTIAPAASYRDVIVAVTWVDDGIARQVTLQSRTNL